MKRWRVAIDLGGTHVRTALANGDLSLLARTDEPTRLEGGPEIVADQIADQVRLSATLGGVQWSDISDAVIGAPGPLDAVRGVMLSPPNLPGWDGIPLREYLETRLSIPIHILNDANAGALGEFRKGAGRGHRNFVYLTVSTGIGGGIVVDGRLLEGTTGMAGEIGHTTVDRHGPICRCGNLGCVESLASGTAIARRFREAVARGGPTTVTAGGDGHQIRAEDVVKAAEGGDPLASAVLRDSAEALGFAVINVIHTFNPEVVALGGGVTKAGPLLFEPVRDIVNRFGIRVLTRRVEIVPAELGEDVGLIGAAAFTPLER